ncbi:MAG: hypothetical protein KAU58_07005, partial [Candidatus Omnitrophica bacterium]|nr:hypothetical protein [Candidatus Omnitrophota bacterium]
MIAGLLNKNFIKLISLLLSISMFWQGVVWADPDVFQKNTLQPYTVFTMPKSEDAFFMLASGYLGFYLSGIENDPRNRNVARIKYLINSALKKIQDSKGIPTKIRKTIPDKVKFHQRQSAIIIDMGQYKIRYFNHNIPKSEIPCTEDSGISYEVLQTHVGQYLSRQILIRKALLPPSDGTDTLIEEPVEPDSSVLETADGEKKGQETAKQQAAAVKVLDLVAGFQKLSELVGELLQKRDNVVILITGKRGVGKTTIAGLLGKGFAGIRKEEILSIEQDEIHNLRKSAEERQKVFNDRVKRDGAGKKIIIVEGFYASENFGPDSVLKKPDMLVILQTDKKIRQIRIARKMGGTGWLARFTTVLLEDDKEPVYPEVEHQLNISNNKELKDIKDGIESILRPSEAKEDVSISKSDDSQYTIFTRFYNGLQRFIQFIQEKLIVLYSVGYIADYLERYGHFIPAGSISPAFSDLSTASFPESNVALLSLSLCAAGINGVGKRSQLEKARKLWKEGKYDEVIRICSHLKGSLEKRKNKEDFIDCLNLLGFAYYKNIEYSQAATIFNEALRTAKAAGIRDDLMETFSKYKLYSEALSNLGDAQKALSIIQNGLKAYPRDIELRSLLGAFYYDTQKMDASEEVFLKILEELPLDDTARRYFIYFRLGMISVKRENFKAAKKRFSKSLKAKPDYAESYYRLGWC